MSGAVYQFENVVGLANEVRVEPKSVGASQLIAGGDAGGAAKFEGASDVGGSGTLGVALSEGTGLVGRSVDPVFGGGRGGSGPDEAAVSAVTRMTELGDEKLPASSRCTACTS